MGLRCWHMEAGEMTPGGLVLGTCIAGVQHFITLHYLLVAVSFYFSFVYNYTFHFPRFTDNFTKKELWELGRAIEASNRRGLT